MLIAQNNNESFVGGLGILSQRFLEGVFNLLNKYKILYFNKNGGYFPHSDDLKITETRQSVNFVYPKERILTLTDIKISKFEGGKHWYVTTSEGEIIEDGDMEKFNTYEYAESIAKRYIDQYNKNYSLK
jgi:hypothetical protein